MIYHKNNNYYIKQGNLYYLAEITIKKHTISIMPSNEYVTELEDAEEISFQELKERLVGGNSE